MQHIASQCIGCGLFERRSLHHEDEYQSSVPLERLRTSNFAATDEEIFHVQSTILPTISDDISSIDSKLAALRKVITSMEEERQALQHVKKKYSDLISLHRTLPLEIWSQIFLDTLPNRNYIDAFDASGPIWQLSHVCQRWRSVALSLRSCWCTISIRLPEAAQSEGHLQRLETIIQRSLQGPLALSLYDDFDRQGLGSAPSIVKRMLEIIFAESHRWRRVYLPDSRMYGNVLSAPLLNHLPRLESLSLTFGVLNPGTYFAAFKGCPQLRTLSLCGRIPPVLDLPWAQITELDLSSVDVDDKETRRACLRLIRQCSSLESIDMSAWNSVDNDEAVNTAIICPNMCKISNTPALVVDALTLPQLQEALLDPDSEIILSSFYRLLVRSNCFGTLTKLWLDKVVLASSPEHSLHSILSQTHNLALLDLSVSLGEFDDEIDALDRAQIAAMVKSLEVVSTQSVTFLPLLSSLDIQVETHNHAWRLRDLGPVGSFASMVKARWKGDGLARLERCHVGVHARHVNSTTASFRPREEDLNPEDRRIFQALVDEGMDLSIRVRSDFIEGSNAVFSIP